MLPRHGGVGVDTPDGGSVVKGFEMANAIQSVGGA